MLLATIPVYDSDSEEAPGKKKKSEEPIKEAESAEDIIKLFGGE